jgi:hypothetical protein
MGAPLKTARKRRGAVTALHQIATITVPGPCPQCSCRVVALADSGRITCCRCKEDRGALDTETLAFIKAVQKTFGPIPEIVLRDKNSTQTKSDRHLANLAARERARKEDAA